MSKERLGFDIEIEMKHLKKILNKDDSLTISSRFVKYLIEQAERAQELETVIEQDKRQSVLEGLYEQNKRYREALFKMDDYDIELGDMREDMQEKLLQIKYIKDKALEE